MNKQTKIYLNPKISHFSWKQTTDPRKPKQVKIYVPLPIPKLKGRDIKDGIKISPTHIYAIVRGEKEPIIDVS